MGYTNADGSSLVGALKPDTTGLALQLDASGNLKVSPGGNTVTNPVITQDQVRAWLQGAQIYTLTLGNFSSAAGTNEYGISIFNPTANSKNILIYSILATNGGGGATVVMQMLTADTAFTQRNPINSKGGGAASSIQATSRVATTDQTIAGTDKKVATIASASFEMLTPGDAILLPQGSDNGLVTYIQTYAAGINSLTATWAEY